MAVILDIPMPENCVECDERQIRQLLWCKLIYSGCANCGRHPDCPLKEVPSGKWIDVYKGSLIDEYRCSNCNSNPPTKKVGITWGWDFTNYCPNCGAKMVEPQESEIKPLRSIRRWE